MHLYFRIHFTTWNYSSSRFRSFFFFFLGFYYAFFFFNFKFTVISGDGFCIIIYNDPFCYAARPNKLFSFTLFRERRDARAIRALQSDLKAEIEKKNKKRGDCKHCAGLTHTSHFSGNVRKIEVTFSSGNCVAGDRLLSI